MSILNRKPTVRLSHGIQSEETNQEEGPKSPGVDGCSNAEVEDMGRPSIDTPGIQKDSEQEGAQRPADKERCKGGRTADANVLDEDSTSDPSNDRTGETNEENCKGDIAVSDGDEEVTNGHSIDTLADMTTVTNDNVEKDGQMNIEDLVEHHEVPQTLTKKESKKRKSVTDLRDEHPNKKIRKSKRLEEKRLAKQMKAKID